MKIILLAINARYTHTNLAVYYLRNYLDRRKYQSLILEKTIQDPVWEIISAIKDFNPAVLCLSCYIWNQKQNQEIISNIKKILPKLIIVCGGPDCSYNASEWLIKFPQIDYLIKGPGEKSFDELQKRNFHSSQKIYQLPNFPPQFLKTAYTKKDLINCQDRYIYYEASRGCPFQCSYCISSLVDQDDVYKDFSQVKKELVFILKHKPLLIKFIDRSFNVHTILAEKIWDFIANLNTNTKFHFEIHPLFLNQMQLRILAQMPPQRIQLEVGIQTIHDDTLRLINRIGRWNDIKKNLHSLTKLKHIHLHFDMLIGLPNESFAMCKSSFNKIFALCPDHFQIGFLKLLPGTAIAQEIDLWGYQYQEHAPYRVFSSHHLSFVQMEKFSLVEMAVNIIYNSQIMVNFCWALAHLREWNSLFFHEQEYHHLKQTTTISEEKKNKLTSLPLLFTFYYSFGLFLRKNNINKATSERKKTFHLMVQFLETQDYIAMNREGKEFLLDFLRYDWFLGSNTHFYPDFLEAKHCDTLKKEIYLVVKRNLQNRGYRKELITNTVFFQAKSKLFCQKILHGTESWIQINGDIINI